MHASLGYDAKEAFDEDVLEVIILFEDDGSGPIHTPFRDWTRQNLYKAPSSVVLNFASCFKFYLQVRCPCLARQTCFAGKKMHAAAMAFCEMKALFILN